MPNVSATLSFLYGLQLFGMKAGLRNIRALLAYLGHPEDAVRSVHVAGTNGKGSTAAMIASALTASGYRTGLYTSPHLRRFPERIRIDGAPIPDADLIRYAEALRPAIIRTKSTFFEATTAIAFAYFADSGVDAAVIETGLGGRLDATNAIDPLLSVITGIGLDHTEHLGGTLAEIAREKAGIIKRGVPCLLGAVDRSSLAVIERTAAARRAPLVRVRPPRPEEISGESLSGLVLAVESPLAPSGSLSVSMAGAHQARNARLALAALEHLGAQGGFGRLTPRSVAAGFAAIRRSTGLRGRIDTLSRSPLVVADVGHNADGIRTLVLALKRLVVGRAVIVFGVMKEKDCGAMADALAPIARTVVAVRPATDRARESGSIVGEFHARSMRALDGGSVREGLSAGLGERREGELLLVAGSHYVVGEAMDALGVR